MKEGVEISAKSWSHINKKESLAENKRDLLYSHIVNLNSFSETLQRNLGKASDSLS